MYPTDDTRMFFAWEAADGYVDAWGKTSPV